MDFSYYSRIMTISTNLKLELRKQAHHLKPVVIIGNNGLTEAVQLEIERALLAHELIKIKINAGDKDERLGMITTICDERQAELIQIIGRTATIYRENDDHTDAL